MTAGDRRDRRQCFVRTREEKRENFYPVSIIITLIIIIISTNLCWSTLNASYTHVKRDIDWKKLKIKLNV